MPKRTDIQRILIIGAGPIIISQACEFDYSGTQACKALKEEGYEVVLVNSNPATIMTDPETADRIYVEPITPDIVAFGLQAHVPAQSLDGGKALISQHAQHIGPAPLAGRVISPQNLGTSEWFDEPTDVRRPLDALRESRRHGIGLSGKSPRHSAYEAVLALKSSVQDSTS